MIAQVTKIFKYRELLLNLIIKDLKVRYRGAVLGYLWSLLNPVLMMLVYTFIFSFIARMEVENYPSFLLCALLPWSFFATTLTASSISIVDNFNLINKVYFPREIFPISVIFSNLTYLIISMMVLMFFLFFSGIKTGLPVLFLPVVILVHVVFTIGISLILSSLTVFYRDLKYILEVVVMVWFFATPVIYPLSMVPENFKVFYILNPMVGIISAYRSILLYGELPAFSTFSAIFVISLTAFFTGHYVFKKYDYSIPKML